MRNILITGANGFLGKKLVDAFLRTTDNRLILVARDVNNLPKSGGGGRTSCCSVEDLLSNKLNVDLVDIVIHSAFARAHKGISAMSQSLLFTKQIVELFSRSQIFGFVNISSQEVYGSCDEFPWKENMLPQVSSPYGLAKYSSELICSFDIFPKRTKSVSLRIPGLFGVDTYHRMINKFVANAINRNPIKIIGGKQVFSQLDVRDAAGAIVALCNTPSQQWKKVYNVGYTKSYGIVDIAKMVVEVAMDFDLPMVDIDIIETDDILYAELDSSLFYNDTGWNPKYSLRESIRDIFAYQMNLGVTNT